ncbi:MAG TPA: ABC transporter permease subunit [Candidatus Limnocylindria bacterium]|nr:ABC transporter permease subunit [Candidatus Limnocylindria bacterium]
MSASPETAGTIYDIGYRHYDGPRLGRRGAVSAIVRAGLRALFGLGRSGRAKILPWGTLALALLPAVIAVAIRVLAGDIIELYSYDNYLWEIGALLPIFLAAQAPELVVNDVRHSVLPLYFSRPISRLDYVLAKGGALALALLSITLLPVLLLFLGRVLAAEDIVAAFGDEAGSLVKIVGNALLHAVVLASIGLAICAVAGRRAYAAGAVLALFLIGGVVSASFQEQGGALADWAPFVNPLSILDGTREWLFGGVSPNSPVRAADVPGPMYAVATLILLGVSWAVLAVRYRRIAT